MCCGTAKRAATRVSSTSTGTAPTRHCATRCWRHSSANPMASRCDPGRSPWRARIGAPVIRYYDNRFPIRDRGPCRNRRGGAGCVRSGDGGGQGASASLCWSASTTGSPGGAPRATKSTGDASSTSTAWPRCGSRTRRCSRRRMRRLLRLYADGLIDGVRVDHVDGLADPPGYCRRCGSLAMTAQRPADAPWALCRCRKDPGTPASDLPDDWEVDGTSGYDFMDEVNALLHDPSGEAPLRELWSSVSGRTADFADEEVAARREVLDRSFTSQLDAAAASLHRIARMRLGDARCHVRRDPSRAGSTAGAFSGLSQLRMRATIRGRRCRICQGGGGSDGGLPCSRSTDRRIAGSDGSVARRRRELDRDARGAAIRPLPATECAAGGEGGGGHSVLPIWRSAIAQ